MKKILLLITAFIIFSCAEKDKKIQQIEKLVEENAMGNDLNYEPISMTKVETVSYQDMLDVFVNYVGAENTDIERMIEVVNNAIENTRSSNDVETYNYMKFAKDRLEKYKNANDKNATAYTIYKHKYSINNPLLDGKLINITNYYFFSNEDKLIAYVDESDFKEMKRTQIKHEKMPYEVMLYKKQIN